MLALCLQKLRRTNLAALGSLARQLRLYLLALHPHFAVLLLQKSCTLLASVASWRCYALHIGALHLYSTRIDPTTHRGTVENLALVYLHDASGTRFLLLALLLADPHDAN